MQELRFIWIVIVALLCYACQNVKTDVEYQNVEEHLVSYSTLTIDIPGWIGDIVKNNEQYFCISESSIMETYILSETGKTIHKFEVPEELNMSYYDLHVRHDSVIMKVYMDGGSFYLDQNKLQWIKINDVDDVIFEDEKFHVNYRDFGGWGGGAWFRDKNSGVEYAIAIRTPTISVIDSVYFLTGRQSAYRIDDPTKLPECDSTEYYKDISGRNYYWFKNKKDDQAFATLYLDSTFWEWSKTNIVTSLFSNDSLFVIYVDSVGTHIGSLKGDRILKRTSIIKGLRASRRHYNYRRSMPPSSNQLFSLLDTEGSVKGILDVKNGAVKVHHLNSAYKVPMIGTSKAEQQVEKLLRFNIDRAKSFDIDTVEFLMSNMKGRGTSPSWKITIGQDLYPNRRGFELETPRIFKVIEDSTITLLADYYYTKTDGSVKVSLYSWNQTVDYAYDIPKIMNKNLVKENFEARLEQIIDSIKDYVGDPISNSSDLKQTKINWETQDGTKLFLSSSNFEDRFQIELRIYNE